MNYKSESKGNECIPLESHLGKQNSFLGTLKTEKYVKHYESIRDMNVLPIYFKCLDSMLHKTNNIFPELTEVTLKEKADAAQVTDRVSLRLIQVNIDLQLIKTLTALMAVEEQTTARGGTQGMTQSEFETGARNKSHTNRENCCNGISKRYE